eukprot:GHVU01223311.1.p2 GENE.GHVU01223311.1~~GHVU01223311.1.p2  ORF type:complete len:102 (+),score=16.16 GHVU01223311.1:106-411(+)
MRKTTVCASLLPPRIAEYAGAQTYVDEEDDIERERDYIDGKMAAASTHPHSSYIRMHACTHTNYTHIHSPQMIYIARPARVRLHCRLPHPIYIYISERASE